MDDINTTVSEQLQQLQMLMQRISFHGSAGNGIHNPHRGQGRILAILKMKPEISQKELTYLLNMSKQALAELLAKLERGGYISRGVSEDDTRSKTVILTEEGAKAAEDVGDSFPDTEKLFDCLNGDELATFSEYLSRIINRCEEQFPDDGYEERRRTMEEFKTRYGHGHGHGHGFDGHGRRGNFHHGRHKHPADQGF